tara:strand:- start:3582 stop:3761 length:180 start_codon:yes stop_codon:yes gene_type:complete
MRVGNVEDGYKTINSLQKVVDRKVLSPVDRDLIRDAKYILEEMFRLLESTGKCDIKRNI